MWHDDLRLYLRLLTYVRPFWLRFLVAIVAMLGVSGLTALLAWLVKPVLDEVFVHRQVHMLYILPPLIVLLYLAKGGLAFLHTYQMNYIGFTTTARIREEIFTHLQRQPHSFFDGQSTGTLMSRISFDVMLLQESVTKVVTTFFRDSFTVVGLVGVIFYREWRLALFAVAVLPLAGLIVYHLSRRLRKLSTASQKSMAELKNLMQENFSGQRLVKAFAREEFESSRFIRANQKFLKIRLKQAVMRNLSPPLMDFLASLSMAGIIFYGGYNVIQGYSTPGTFFSFLAALLMLYQPIKGLTSVHNSVQEGLAAAQRVFGLLDLPPTIQDRPGARPLPPLEREIRYERVSFSYDGHKPTLEDISLTVHKGEMVALVGPSGAGKTTLLSLLPRFYDVTAGAILIDGVDIREVTLASLRGQIGVVSQQTFLFNETVRFNVAYGRPEAGEAEIIQALTHANAWDFVQALPQGLDTVIGERGVRLSGGEQQRLAIARAILKDPPILILDEATSSLDSESERLVQEALDRLVVGRTTLVIAHRLSTVMGASRIVVLDAGRIVEVGSHAELLRRGGLYRRLYERQFGPAGVVALPRAASSSRS
ncbi:MAG: lipid A export permease/ATP-binding protein MsbA [Syntrophobacterales bacterium]|nr:lipid A export permease/ATP-binding protein MsbA [Syntrophobacterales bacterium]